MASLPIRLSPDLRSCSRGFQSLTDGSIELDLWFALYGIADRKWVMRWSGWNNYRHGLGRFGLSRRRLASLRRLRNLRARLLYGWRDRLLWSVFRHLRCNFKNKNK